MVKLIIIMLLWTNLFLGLFMKLNIDLKRVPILLKIILCIIFPGVILAMSQQNIKRIISTGIDKLSIRFINLLDYLKGDYEK